MNEEEATNVQVDVEPTYDAIDHWVVLTTNGATPRVLKNEPPRLASNEVALKLRLMVPRRVKKLMQTITVKLPDVAAHVANIEVSVPDVEG